ncbi:MAG TPA: MarR family transcriptional regulator [Mobilitalea sp.]|nr:MarR family transcriptional regulator [Mobilitalea sp.]
MEKTETKQMIDAFSEVIKSIHQQSYDKLDKIKLYPGQPKLLALIKENEGLTQKELARRNCVKPATITGMLLKLELNKYVYRNPDTKDKRIMRVYLTPEGRIMAEYGEKLLISMTEKMFEGFTDEEMKTYLRLTYKVRDNLQYNIEQEKTT